MATLRVSHILSDVKGGVASQVESLATAQMAQGLSVRVIQLRESGPGTIRLRQAKIPVEVLHCTSGHDPTLIPRLHKALRGGQDILHWHERPLLGALEAARRHERVVTTIHGVVPDAPITLSQRLTLLGYAFSVDGAIAVSQHVADTCRARRIFPKCKWITVPNGINTKDFSPAVDRSVPDGKVPIRLIIVARLEPDKHVDDAIRVVAALRKQGIDCSLDIVGDGSQRDTLMDIVHQETLDQTVNFLGRVEKPVHLLQQSHGFLLLSEYESFCLAAIEAASCAVPVFSYPVGGGVHEWLKNGYAGCISEERRPENLCETILGICQKPSQWKELAKSAREIACEYSAEKTCEKIIEFYHSM